MNNREKRQRQEERARSRARQRAEQDVVYTQPTPFNRNRFFLRLATVVAIVLAILFGMSIFFKVGDVQVSGNVKYDTWTVREASGIVDGENLLTLSKAQIAGNIENKLPYIDQVRIGIKLPDTVVIQVKELKVTYSVQDQTGAWWLLDADGRVVDSCTVAEAENVTKILGVLIEKPSVGANAVAYELPPKTDKDGNQVQVTVFERERLAAVISVMQELEKVGFIGTMDSVNVTDMGKIELWYDARFQIVLGDTSDLSAKLKDLHTVIHNQMGPKDTGVLDISDGKVKHNHFQ